MEDKVANGDGGGGLAVDGAALLVEGGQRIIKESREILGMIEEVGD